MPSIETLLTFALASLLLSMSPGPSNLYIMARTISQGYKTGACAASGMAVGSLIYVLATALGIAAIFQYSPLTYSIVKLTGAAYLIYLGYTHFSHANDGENERPKVVPMTHKKVFRQSIFVELTNPKTALFFLAFLPQFVDVSSGSVVTQLVVLGFTYTLIAFCSDISVVTLSGKLGKWLSTHPLFIQWQDRFSGAILIAIGGYIAVEGITENIELSTK